MAERKITGALALRGKTYTAGMEEALYDAASRHGVDLSHPRFKASLAGDWAQAGDGDALPEGFPGLKALLAEGILTYSDLRDADYASVKGIGASTAKAIKKALG